MAIKKNKKRFDPRYFMDEKTENSLNEEKSKRPGLRIPASNPAADKWHREQADAAEEKEKERKEGPIDNNVGRYGQIPEGIENITPENLATVVQAVLQIGQNFAPAVLMGALGMKLKDAIDYLRANSPPEAPPKEELNEINEPAVFLSQIQAAMAQTGWYTEEELQSRISAMAELMSPQVVKALETIANNSQAVGDIHMKLGAKALSDGRIDKLEPSTRNLLRILKVLGKYQSEWDR